MCSVFCNRDVYISPHNAILQSIKKIKFTFSYSGSIDYTIEIHTKYNKRQKIKDTIMSGKNKIEYISILIKSLFYFTLPVKERYFLLSKLMENFQSVINEEKVTNSKVIETDTQ